MKPTFLSELIIERYRYGMFHVRTSCTERVQTNTIVKVWMDNDGYYCQEADEWMGGFSGNPEPNKVSKQIVESKDFQQYIIQAVKSDNGLYGLARNVEYV